ncbi:tetratricopeptide repeat protein [Vreelandella olivaria]|uniref:tetratricopeptide repeat protein n=1 Tax=Vreelandella olivaria TaxID=390919 RepID=UPI00201F6D56|nr:tetratricopeptide repeat protein [Halomonas olivaria]
MKKNEDCVVSAMEAYNKKDWNAVDLLYSRLDLNVVNLSHKNKVQWVVSLKKSFSFDKAENLITYFLREERADLRYIWLYHLAECKQYSGKYQEAIELYESVIRYKKGHKNSFFRLSQCCLKRREYSSALFYINEALACSSSLLFVAQLATIYYRQNNWKCCVDTLKNAMTEFDNNNFRPVWVFYYADSLYHLNNFTESSSSFKLLMKFKDVKSSWLYKAFRVFFKNKEFDFAEVALLNAIVADPKSSKLYLEMARLHSLKKNIKEAEIFYKKSADLGNSIAQHELLSFDENKRIKISPRQLLTPQRLDLLVKLQYAKHLISEKEENSSIDWYKIYLRHIYLRTRGNEPGSSHKNNLIDYTIIFSEVINSIRNNGFNDLYSVPVAKDGIPVNGAHRTAAALALKIESIPIVLSNKEVGAKWDLEWFINHGFNEKEVHELVYSWVDNTELNPHIALVWPTVYDSWDKIIGFISNKVSIVYSKVMDFSSEGLKDFVKDVYSVDSPSDFSSTIMRKADFISDSGNQVLVLLLDNKDDVCVGLKAAVRDEFCHFLPNDPFSIVHISDSRGEVKHLNMMLFHYETSKFLECRNFGTTENISLWIKEAKEYFKKMCINSLDVCGVGGSVLNVYGIKKSDDLDITVASNIRWSFFSDKAQQVSDNVDIVSRDYYRSIDKTVFDDALIYDRALYIYVRGLKFANIDVVRDRKMFSLRKKDLMDLRLIGDYYANR